MPLDIMTYILAAALRAAQLVIVYTLDLRGTNAAEVNVHV